MKKRKPDLEAIKRMRKGHAGNRYHELRLMAREAGPQQTKEEKADYYIRLLLEMADRGLVKVEQDSDDPMVWRVWHPGHPDRVAHWACRSGWWHIPAVMEHRAIVQPRIRDRYLKTLLEELGVKREKGRSIEAWLDDLDERRER